MAKLDQLEDLDENTEYSVRNVPELLKELHDITISYPSTSTIRRRLKELDLKNVTIVKRIVRTYF